MTPCSAHCKNLRMTHTIPVRRAVFPVAGLGTRFLPATKTLPKEMIPLNDRPVIQHSVEEAREAGIEDVDKIVGLELGEDDYLTKPYNPRELVARVRAILRRYQTGQKPGETMEIGRLRIDLPRQEVSIAGQPVKLRTKEFALLTTFVQNPGIVMSREKLLETVWGLDYYGESRTVDVHVNHLREKIAGSGAQIETVRGTGYKITLKEGS